MRFLIVSHSWFVSSNGFTVDEVEADDMKHAKLLAAERQCDLDDTFNKTRSKVIQIADNEHLAPRRLTLWERITGRLSYTDA